MREVFQFTARSLETANPVPFGALIVNTRTGETLMRGTNAVLRESDPSSHAETRTVRLACKKLKRPSLAGYTMDSTCEPCPMCMANALWAGLDRLKAVDRATLVAFYIRGRSLKQMSREFETPIGTIKRRLHVARKRLRRQMERASASPPAGSTRREPREERELLELTCV